MNSYSSLNLLGERLQEREESLSFWDILKSRFIPASKYVAVTISIPHLIYLRTETYCEILSEIAEEPFQSKHFLSVIYKDFLFKFYRYNQYEKTKQLIQRYNAEHSYVVIRDYKLKEDIILKDHNQKGKMTFTFQMKRQMALKGELLLAELDDMYGVTTSLERLLEILWIDYIKSSKQMSEKKMISEFLKLLKENE